MTDDDRIIIGGIVSTDCRGQMHAGCIAYGIVGTDG